MFLSERRSKHPLLFLYFGRSGLTKETDIKSQLGFWDWAETKGLLWERRVQGEGFLRKLHRRERGEEGPEKYHGVYTNLGRRGLGGKKKGILHQWFKTIRSAQNNNGYDRIWGRSLKEPDGIETKEKEREK